MAERPRVSFVLVNWNTRDLVMQCIGDLRRQAEVIGGEIILVDNGSSDGSAEAIADAYPDVRLIRNPENLGFSRATNQGIRASRAPIVTVLNSDILVGEADLGKALEVVENNPRIGALGCALVDGEGNLWTYDNRFPTPFQIALWEHLPGFITRPRMRRRKVVLNLSEVDWLAGACLFMRRSALETIGLFDERFFLYKEDVDLCLRLRKAGYWVLFFDGVHLQHLVAQSTRRNPGRRSDRAHVEGFRSSALYARKHVGPGAARLIVACLRAILLARMAKNLITFCLFGHERDREKLAWMWEAFHTLNSPPNGGEGRLDAERMDDAA